MNTILYCFGDTGNHSNELKKMINMIYKQAHLSAQMGAQNIILLGDNFYCDGVNYNDGPEWNNFKKIFFNKSIPIYSILGNHDYIKAPMAQITSKNFIMPYYYYFKQINNIGCWFIDTQILDPGDKMYINNPYIYLYDSLIKAHSNYNDAFNNHILWLDNEFEKHKHLKYKLVFGHYPIISSGVYGENIKLYSILMKYFLKYNITAYISGHDHNLQHSQLKINNYMFNQFISGANDNTIKYPIQEVNNNFFSIDPGFLKIQMYKTKLKFQFKNIKNKTLYTYSPVT